MLRCMRSLRNHLNLWRQLLAINAKLAGWLKSWAAPQPQLRPRRAPSRYVRPSLEALEGRLVPTYVFLGSINYSTTEGQGPAALSVKLDSPSSQTVTVDYATADQTAKAGTDYTSTSGLLTFQPGTTQQTVNVPILDDNQSGETSPEVFQFILSNAVNATVGTPNMATVQIQEDNDTSSPTLTNPGNQSNTEGDTVSLQMQASGGTGPYNYGSNNLPPGLSIDGNSGLISGTIDYTAAEQNGGNYPVTITAIDSTGASVSSSFTWTVADKNTTPALDAPGDQTNWEGDAVALQLNATDPDGDSLTYSATGLPSGLSINATTGLISGVLAAPAGSHSPYAVTVSASDGVNTASQSFTWTVARVQIDPLADQSNLIGDSVSVPVNAFGESGQSLTYSATGLPPGVSINSTTGLISGTIASNSSVTTPYNVTVTATDGTDPASTSFAWTIGNFTLDNPGDQTNAEGDAVALQPTVESNGTPNLTYSATGLPAGLAINPTTGLIAGTISNLASNNSPYSVTVSATDGTSTSSQIFNWTVTHVLLSSPGSPINAPGDVVSLQVQASDPDKDALTYTATGLPSGLSINSGTGLITGTVASTAGSDTPYSVTVTASDGTHNASSTFNWTVSNQAVTVTNPGTQNNAEGANVSLQINATNPTGNPLSYTASGLPAGLQIDYASGIISGTIDGAAAETNGGVYTVMVLADDGQGNNGSASFTWNVTHTNQAPTLDNPGDQMGRAGDVVSLPLSGYDGDGDNVTYAATGLPAGLSVDPSSGIISGTLPASAASATPYSVTVTASDGSLTADQTFNWTVTASQVVLTSPGDQTNTEGDNVSLQLSATDAGNLPLTYQVSSLPPGLSVNGSGLISGTIASGAAANGPYSVIVTATDSAGNSDGKEFLWTVNPSVLTPVVTNPGPQINTQGDVLSLQIEATDPAGNGLTYTATGLPPGLTIDPATGLISGVLSNNSASSNPYNVTVTAADGSNSGSTSFTWSVTNQVVTVTNPGTQNSTAGAGVSLQINASDPAQLSLTYAAVGLPPGASIDPITGLISGTLTSTDGGAYQVTVMASDSAGNSGSASFVWNVTYLNQAPTLDPISDQLNYAGDSVSLQLSASDVDGDTVTYSATGLPSGLSLNATTGLISGVLSASASGSPYTVTVTASDGTLNATQTFRWFVASGSVTLTSPGDQTNGEGDNVSLQLAASDSAHLSLNYAASGLPPGLSINVSTGLISGTVASGASANGPYVVTVQATDTAGNSAAQQFNWYVNAPAHALALANPGPQSNSAGDSVSLQTQANDPDGDPLTYLASGLPFGLTIDPDTGLISGTIAFSAAQIAGGHYNVTLMVEDGNGDSTSQAFSWIVSYTGQGPWLDNPGSQSNQIGDAALVQLVAGSPTGKPLTYSATGLPSGLALNSATGRISGSISAPTGDYNVTAEVSDGTQVARQAFLWEVGAAPNPDDKKDSPSLKAVSPVDDPGGKNGVFAWPAQWQLTGNSDSGVILQRVKVAHSVKWQLGATKDAKKDQRMPDPAYTPFAFQGLITLDWYEAWIVTRKGDGKNEITPLSVLGDNDLKALSDAGVKLPDKEKLAEMNDWFFQGNPGAYRNPRRAPRTTYGSVTITGSAVFYEGMTLKNLQDMNFNRGSFLKTGSVKLLSYRMDLEGNRDAMTKFLSKYKTLSNEVSRELKASWDPAKDDGKTKVDKTVKP